MAPMRPLDFLVIGAPQSGTTSLWRAFDSHPEICVPSDKERGFFNSDRRFEKGLDQFMSWTFDEADDRCLGTVTPQLMLGDQQELDLLIGRIAETCPDIKLIAMLRNPIDRAISNFRRSRRLYGWDDPDFDAATERMSDESGGLEQIPFIRAGEYGRILSRYAAKFDRAQIKVLFTDDLAARPQWLYREAFMFLGVDPDHDAGTPWLNAGGTSWRVNAAALDELLEELDRSVWPRLSDAEVERGFTWWFKHIWNCEPDDQGMEISDALFARLDDLYRADGRLLQQSMGVNTPLRDSR
jgi:hypothetical protein